MVTDGDGVPNGSPLRHDYVQLEGREGREKREGRDGANGGLVELVLQYLLPT